MDNQEAMDFLCELLDSDVRSLFKRFGLEELSIHRDSFSYTKDGKTVSCYTNVYEREGKGNENQ